MSEQRRPSKEERKAMRDRSRQKVLSETHPRLALIAEHAWAHLVPDDSPASLACFYDDDLQAFQFAVRCPVGPEGEKAWGCSKSIPDIALLAAGDPAWLIQQTIRALWEALRQEANP